MSELLSRAHMHSMTQFSVGPLSLSLSLDLSGERESLAPPNWHWLSLRPPLTLTQSHLERERRAFDVWETQTSNGKIESNRSWAIDHTHRPGPHVMRVELSQNRWLGSIAWPDFFHRVPINHHDDHVKMNSPLTHVCLFLSVCVIMSSSSPCQRNGNKKGAAWISLSFSSRCYYYSLTYKL